jgi:hypothetical protein
LFVKCRVGYVKDREKYIRREGRVMVCSHLISFSGFTASLESVSPSLIQATEPKMHSHLILSVLLAHLTLMAAQQMLRFSCSQLTVERLDPLVNPGLAPSPHLHQIGGGDSFNASMLPETHDPAKLSTCTSCTFSEDFSNYWTAVLYFRARNGTFKRVPQFANEYLTQSGGLTVYYIPPYDGKTKVTAFKPGFRMLVGDPMLRTKQGQVRQLCHRCFGKNFQPFGGAPCTGSDTASLPTGFCAGGIRTTITFPT